MTQLLFYGDISEFSAAAFINRLNAAEKANQSIDVLLNSNGGDVNAGWGIIRQFKQFPYRKKITVHGTASSMASTWLIFSHDVSALEQSKFTLHRASSFFETDPSTMEIVKSINSDIRKAYEAKLNVQEFERLAGVDMDRFFDSEKEPIDLNLNAEEARRIRLINEVLTLEADDIRLINNNLIKASSSRNGVTMINVKEKVMTKEEFKKNHPEVYQSVYAEGVSSVQPDNTSSDATEIESDVTAERERVSAWCELADIDQKAAMEGIKSGKKVTQAVTLEFMKKGMKNNFVQKAEKNSVEGTPQGGGDDADDVQELEAFESKIYANMKINVK